LWRRSCGHPEDESSVGWGGRKIKKKGRRAGRGMWVGAEGVAFICLGTEGIAVVMCESTEGRVVVVSEHRCGH